jgi:uncharacterized protein (TIGR00369 family)
MIMTRERTFSWDDPLAGAKAAQRMNGLQYLEAMRDGELPLPPLLHTLDFHVASLAKGEVAFSFTPQEFHYNPIGSVHGGVVSAILDSAMGCALHSTLDAGYGYTTLELKVNFLRAVTAARGELRAVGKVINAGKRTALTEAQLVDSQGTLYAHGISTCMILAFDKPTAK